MGERCEVCGRPFAYGVAENPHRRPDLCWRPILTTPRAKSWAWDECGTKRVDWRARALRAEADRDTVMSLIVEHVPGAIGDRLRRAIRDRLAGEQEKG